MLHRADMIWSQFRVHVYRSNAFVVAWCTRGVSWSERWAAFFEVPWFVAALSRAGDGEGEDAVRVTVAVAGIRVPTTVTWRPDEDGTFAFATLFTLFLMIFEALRFGFCGDTFTLKYMALLFGNIMHSLYIQSTYHYKLLL